MTHILAIDTSSAWCSVALSLGEKPPLFRHEKVSTGSSQLLLPWIEDLLAEAGLTLSSLDAIAVDVGPGAFTGVRLGVAAVQGLAISVNLPVLSVCSLDAIAAQLSISPGFIKSHPDQFVIAADARMGEVYWARYQSVADALPLRVGDLMLTGPEDVDLVGAQFLAGSAIQEFGDRLFHSLSEPLPTHFLDFQIGVSALGVLMQGIEMFKNGQQQDVRQLEPVYVRNKVALTTAERMLRSHI